jgi:hypothetical protein
LLNTYVRRWLRISSQVRTEIMLSFLKNVAMHDPFMMHSWRVLYALIRRIQKVTPAFLPSDAFPIIYCDIGLIVLLHTIPHALYYYASFTNATACPVVISRTSLLLLVMSWLWSITIIRYFSVETSLCRSKRLPNSIANLTSLLEIAKFSQDLCCN